MAYRLYMFMFEATAGAKIAKRPGRRHAIIGFALGGGHGAALDLARANLKAQGWGQIAVKKGQRVPGHPDKIEDKDMREAAQKALKNQVSFVVFEKPLPVAH